MNWPKFLSTKKQRLIAASITSGIIVLSLIAWLIWDIIDTRRVDTEALTFVPQLTVEFDHPTKASDFIANLNGELLTDPEIDTSALGPQTVTFEYKNLKHRKRASELTIEVVDTIQPIVYGGSDYTVPLNYEGDLTDLMLSGDNLDDHPTREIIGEYDLSKTGDYRLTHRITDQSGNSSQHNFTLHVVKPSNVPSDYQFPGEKDPISAVIKQHKTDQTKIGIDVSSWQGEINWPKAKQAGVEFAIIRIGYQAEFGGELTLDKHALANLENASAAGIPIGVYLYSCATSPADATAQVTWIVEQVKDYELPLGIAFDWEEWGSFNSAGISFRTLNQTAQTFLNATREAGYSAMLYGSKTYLEKFWNTGDHQVWLAQYYNRPTYSGDFKIWQLSNTGQVPGINGDVDLDILYKK